jgi:hypothetical protein
MTLYDANEWVCTKRVGNVSILRNLKTGIEISDFNAIIAYPYSKGDLE